MIEVLMPYADIDSHELGTQLHDVAVRNSEELLIRHMPGVIRRYGQDRQHAMDWAEFGQDIPHVSAFAVLDETGHIRGSASIYDGLPLRRQRIPLPPALTPGILSILYPYATHNLHAWVDKDSPELLGAAYKALVGYFQTNYSDLQLEARDGQNIQRAWTIEPTRSPNYVHSAIAASGLEKVVSRRFDDGEVRRHVAPCATLYAQIHSQWKNSAGKLSELRHGHVPFRYLADR